MNLLQIEAYLSEALDQEACKATLTQALTSRIVALQTRGIPELTILECLENLCAEPNQLNGEVIEDIMDCMLVKMLGALS